MLVTTSDQTALESAWLGQGMPATGVHATESATVTASPFNAAWADQPALCLQRTPKLPTQPALMAEAFRDTRFPHQPTRRTLADTIQVFAACGHLSGDRAQWLADNKAYPNRLWSAVEGLAPALVQDTHGRIDDALNRSLLDLYPLKAMTQFVLAWHRHLPDCIAPSLVMALRDASRYAQADDQTKSATTIDWHTLNTMMTQCLRGIAAELNDRMSPPQVSNGGIRVDSPLFFAENMTLASPLVITADHMEGIDLSLNPDEDIQPEYWNAVKLALKLIQNHLMPINTSSDVLEMTMLMAEEFDADVERIHAFLDAYNLDYDDLDAVYDAIEAVAPDLCMIEEPETYEWAHHARIERQLTEDRWTITDRETTARLRQLIKALPAPSDAMERQLSDWLTETVRHLPKRNKGNAWWDVVGTHCTGDMHPRALDEYTPVWLDKEDAIYEALNDQHNYLMQGDDREPVALTWDADPKIILNWCDQMRVGMALVTNLLNRCNNAQI